MRKVNINHAPRKQLEGLPLIGTRRASRIVDYRRVNGYFRSVEELDRVPGIGPKIMARVRPYVSV